MNDELCLRKRIGKKELADDGKWMRRGKPKKGVADDENERCCWWYSTRFKGFIDEGKADKSKFLLFALIMQTKKDWHFHKHTTEIIERSLVWWELQEALFITAKRLFRWDAIVQRRWSMGKDGEDEVSFALWYCIGYPQTRAEHNKQAE